LNLTMSYRNLSIRIPPERDQYTGHERIPSYHPSPRGYDTITKQALLDLQQKNKDLVERLKNAEEAPRLMKNMAESIKQADTRVKELQAQLKIHAADDQKEARVEELRKSAKRVRNLQERIASANSKKRQMENQLKSKRKLIKQFNKAVGEMDQLLEKLAYAKYRSKILEENLVRAREKERELRTARAQVKGMQNDLDGANRELQKLGHALVNAHEQWEKRPRDVSRVRVDGASIGHMKAEKTDVHGRKTRDSVKVVELKDKGPGNTYASTKSYAGRSNKEVDLIREVSKLELTNESIDRLSENIKGENAKLAQEVQELMKIMQKNGITLTPEQMGVPRRIAQPQMVRNVQTFSSPAGVQQMAARPQVVQNVQTAVRSPVGVQRTVARPQNVGQVRSSYGLPAGVQASRVLAQMPTSGQQVSGNQRIVRR